MNILRAVLYIGAFFVCIVGCFSAMLVLGAMWISDGERAREEMRWPD